MKEGSQGAATHLPSPHADGTAMSRVGRRRTLARESGSEWYRQRRREIVQAAAVVFNKKGFQGTSVSAVAAELGIDRASLYYYMSSKEELFDEVVREVTEANVARAGAIELSDEPPAQKLRLLITALMASYGGNYPILYVYIRENLNNVADERSAWATHMRRLNKRYEESVIAIVQQGIDDRSFRPIASARIIAFGVLGIVGWTNRWFVPDRSRETAEEIGAAYADLVLAGLRSDATSRAPTERLRKTSAAPP